MALIWVDADAFPAELRRRPVTSSSPRCAGPTVRVGVSCGRYALADTPLLDLSGPRTYTQLQSAFRPFNFPKGRLYYWKSVYVSDLSDDAIAADHGDGRHSGMSSIRSSGGSGR